MIELLSSVLRDARARSAAALLAVNGRGRLVGLTAALLGLAILLTPALAHANTVVSLTFDDGPADQYQARSVLASHNMHGTFYVNSGRIGTNGYMSRTQITDLQNDGNEIGGHTVSHADLPTLDTDEQKRQVCNDRQALLQQGFNIYDFAYPYGDFDSGSKTVVKNCGYDNARSVGGIASPGTCGGCPSAEPIPPTDIYAISTPDSIKSDTSLETMKGFVTQAKSGGGLVSLVFHHFCAGSTCDIYSVDPARFSAFLDWLQGQSASGVSVQTMHGVLGGPLQPSVAGPPPSATGTSSNLVQNPSLETDANADKVPDCYTLGGFGNNAATWTRTTDAHTGSFGEQLSMSSFTDGDRKLVSRQDLGACAPAAKPGHQYVIGAWYKSTAPVRLVAYTRSTAGGWTFWEQAANPAPASAGWTHATWTTPVVPPDVTALSIGPSLRSTGTVTMDDFSMVDADQTPPTVSLTSPSDGARVRGNVTLTADAADNAGVDHVDFLLNGQRAATVNSAPYRYVWDTTTSVDDTVAVTARAYDTAGNTTTASTRMVTVANVDTAPPVTTISCSGAPCSGGYYTAPPSVSLSATDNNAGVDSTHYTTDGSDPTLTSPTYTAPLSVASNTTLKYRSWDTAGNVEAVQAQQINVDTRPPISQISCAGAPCSSAFYTTPVTLSLAAGDDNSGVAAIRYTTDGSDPTPFSPAYSPLTPPVLAGTATVKYRGFDVAGNAEPINSQLVKVDTTPPTSAIACDAGTCADLYKQPVSVSLSASDLDSGVSGIYYTTDGSDPTNASTQYTGAFQVSSNTIVKYRAYDNVGHAEPVKSRALNVDATAPESVITCDGGSCSTGFASAPVGVALSATDDNSGVQAIRYTTDGSDPTSSSSEYSEPLTVSGKTTVKFRAYDRAGNAESVNSQLVKVDTTAPTSSIACNGGACPDYSNGAVSVELSATDSDSGVSAIYYTTDGSDPTSSTTPYAGAFEVSSNTTVRYRAYDNVGHAEDVRARAITVDSIAPLSAITCDGGTCSSEFATDPVGVALSATDENSGVNSIHYTTDGTDPTALSPEYSPLAPLTLASTTTVKYRAFDNAANPEPVNTQTVYIDTTPPQSSVQCDGSECGPGYSHPVSVSLSATDADSGVSGIYYTTDGSEPTASSTRYSAAITLSGTTTIKYRAYDSVGHAEPVQTHTVSIDTTPPTSSIACNDGACSGDYYGAPVTVKLSGTDDTPGSVTVRYTTDGSDPTTSSTTYESPFTVSATTTVKYRAYDVAGNAEGVRSQKILVDTDPPSTSANCNGSTCSGFYNSPVAVGLNATDGDSGVNAIYYTTDGSDPSTSSTRYAGAFTVPATTVVKYRGYDNVGHAESVKSQTVRIDATAPSSQLSCDGGACSSGYASAPVTVALSATDDSSGVAAMRYTTDGTDPTSSSPAYQGAFTVASTTTVRYRAYDVAGNAESTKSQVVKVDTTPPSSSIKCNGSACQASLYPSAVSVTLTAADNDSGVAAIRYTTNGNDPTTSSPAYTGPVTVSQNATVKYRAYDNVGRAEAVNAQAIQVAGTNLLQNPSLETDANSDGVPDCWLLGGFGTNAFSWTRTSDAHSGVFGELLQLSSITDGNRKLVSTQDTGKCAYKGTSGHSYTATGWYKGSQQPRWAAYYRDSAGSWVWWAQSALLSTSAGWTKATWTTPAFPSGATNISVGLSLEKTGTLTMDDFGLSDNG